MRALRIEIYFPKSIDWKKELKEKILKYSIPFSISPSNVVLVLPSLNDFSIKIRILLSVYDKDDINFVVPGAIEFYVSDFLDK